MVRFAKPHISVIYTEQWRNMMVLNNQDFIIENLTVRFTIYVFSVIFKNSAAVTNTRPVWFYYLKMCVIHHSLKLSFEKVSFLDPN